MPPDHAGARGAHGHRMGAHPPANPKPPPQPPPGFGQRPVAAGNRYLELKRGRPALLQRYIREEKVDAAGMQRHYDDATAFVGECTEMCPEYERHEREFEKTVDRYEMVPGTGANGVAAQIDHARAVKRYRRSAAGDDPALPCDVRTPATLLQTLDYLFNEILGVHGIQNATHLFIWDRTRGINKDFQLQNWRGPERVVACEKIFRYLAVAMHHQSLAVRDADERAYDGKQDYEQLCKVLLTLLDLYDDPALTFQSPHEAEFRAYAVYVHLLDPLPPRLETLRDAVFDDPRLQRAVQFHAWASQHYGKDKGRSLRYSEAAQGNYEAFFRAVATRLVPGESYVEACLLELSFNAVRRGALAALAAACSSKYGYPLADLVRVGGFDSVESAAMFAAQFGIHRMPQQPGVLRIGKGAHRTWAEPSERLPPPRSAAVSRLLGPYSLVDIVHGIGRAHESTVSGGGAVWASGTGVQFTPAPFSRGTFPLSVSAPVISSGPVASSRPLTAPLVPSVAGGPLPVAPQPSNVPSGVATAFSAKPAWSLNAGLPVGPVGAPGGPQMSFVPVATGAPQIATVPSAPQKVPLVAAPADQNLASHQPKLALAPVNPATAAPAAPVQQALEPPSRPKPPQIPRALVNEYVSKLVAEIATQELGLVAALTCAWQRSTRLQAEEVADGLIREVTEEWARFAMAQELSSQRATAQAAMANAQEQIVRGIVEAVTDAMVTHVAIRVAHDAQSQALSRRFAVRQVAARAREIGRRRRARDAQRRAADEHNERLRRTVAALGMTLRPVAPVGATGTLETPLGAPLAESIPRADAEKAASPSEPRNVALVGLGPLQSLQAADGNETLPLRVVLVAPVAVPADTFDLYSHRALLANEWLRLKLRLDGSETSARASFSADEPLALVLQLWTNNDATKSETLGENLGDSVARARQATPAGGRLGSVAVAVVQIAPFTAATHGSTDMWWARERRRVFEVLASLPRGAHPRLLLVASPTAEWPVTDAQLQTAPSISHDVALLVEARVVESVATVAVPLLASGTNASGAERDAILESALRETLQPPPPVPPLAAAFDKDVFQPFVGASWEATLRQLRTAGAHCGGVRTLQTRLAIARFIVQSWNAFLELAAHILAHSSLEKVDWPPAALAEKPIVPPLPTGLETAPPAGWNAAERLAALRTALAAFAVPALARTPQEDSAPAPASPSPSLATEGRFVVPATVARAVASAAADQKLRDESAAFSLARRWAAEMPAALLSNGKDTLVAFEQPMLLFLQQAGSARASSLDAAFAALRDMLLRWTAALAPILARERLFYLSDRAMAAGRAYQSQSAHSLARIVQTIADEPPPPTPSPGQLELMRPSASSSPDRLQPLHPREASIRAYSSVSSVASFSEYSSVAGDDVFDASLGGSRSVFREDVSMGAASLLSGTSSRAASKRKRSSKRHLALKVHRQSQALSAALEALEATAQLARRSLE